ncbi:MAG: ABC transporter ATPase [Olsenella sp.]|nr:ABC transporter ATPase [Olsenella sp.]
MCEWNKQMILNDLILALVINTSATLLAGVPLTWANWYPYTCVAFTTNVVGQLVLPTGAWARAATRRMADGTGRLLAQVFIENLIFVTVISLTEAVTQVGPSGMLAAWSATYLQLVAIGYVTSVALALVGERRARA